MTQLLIHQPDTGAEASDQTLFGGRPSAPAHAVTWPLCRECGGAMQFQGQIRTGDDELLLLFMCQNDPGGCEEWDADAGGNQAIAVRAHALQLLQPPGQGETLRNTRYGMILQSMENPSYEQARQEWIARSGQPGREVLGQQGGQPSWLQSEETPNCDACAQPMEFVAQLEEGPNWENDMNFGGGGCAYVFRCGCQGTPAKSAKWLWQC